tara:strand:- start:257 stop:997 length:741 start_codon:yes stop_codon:yes gene_type:complete
MYNYIVTNNNYNNYANNGGGSSTMKKKYGSKFNKISSKSNFSINGNGHHTYIGNPNSNFTFDPFSNSSNILLCKTNDNSIKSSVKNTKGLINSKLYESPVNSFKCYLDVNKELVTRYNDDINGLDLTNCDTSCKSILSNAGVNKHFLNKDSSTKTAEKKCVVDRTDYIELLNAKKDNCNKSNIKATSNIRAKCNITKDLKEVNAFIPSYDIYMLKKKNACNYNPRDEFNRGKEANTSIKDPYPNCN